MILPHSVLCPAFQALNWQSLEQQVAVLHRAHTCGFCSATAACSSLRTAWFAFGQPNANHPSQASQGRRSCRRWSRDGRLWDRIVPHVHLGLPSARRGCGAAQVFICTSTKVPKIATSRKYKPPRNGMLEARPERQGQGEGVLSCATVYMRGSAIRPDTDARRPHTPPPYTRPVSGAEQGV